MSTKTLFNGPFGDKDPFWFFLILSVGLHLIFLGGFVSFSSLAGRLLIGVRQQVVEPIIVDVVELPPERAASAGTTRPPTHFAERSQSVEKETYPEGSKGPFVHVPSKPSAPALKPSVKTEPPVKEGAGSSPAGASAAAEAEKGEGAIPSSQGEGVAGGTRPGIDARKEAAQSGSPKAASPAKKPNLFLSDERLGELARKYETESPKGEKGKTLQLNTSELKYAKYLINMKHRIESRWDYPEVASRNGWQGTLRIDFDINKDGSLKEVQLVKSSGYPALDDAAITALRLASPFPPFPEDFAIEDINIKGSFEYTIVYSPRR